MGILNLDGAKPLYPKAAPKTTGRRNMSPSNTAAIVGLSGVGGFAAARMDRLTGDFVGGNRSIDQDLFRDNRRMRARARLLSVDTPFAKKFLQMVPQNVVGPNGITIKSTVTGANGKDTAQTDHINQRIDEEWKRWCKKGRCTADGKFSFAALQRLAARTVACEGESLVKFVYGRQFNDSGFALQVLDNDQLDDSMMMSLANDASVRMGVEVDKYGKPQGYNLWRSHPNDIVPGGRERQRVPAELIVHTFASERPAQTRGYTWMSAAMLPMNQYNRYEEAVVVAARTSAANLAAIEEEYSDDWPGDEDEEGSDTNTDGTQYMSGDAGEFLQLPPGQKIHYSDPKFPTTTHKDFTQTMLRNVASGLLVMYPYLANDLEGVNYSSIRAGVIDERDMWRIVQRWFVEDFIDPIRAAWLKMALLTTLTDIALTPKQMEQYSAHGRGWEWVDPKNDADAAILELGEGLTTYQIKCAEKGLDWQEVALQRKKEQDFFDKNQIVFGVDISGDQGGKGVAAGDETEAAEVDDGKGAKSGKGAK